MRAILAACVCLAICVGAAAPERNRVLAVTGDSGRFTFAPACQDGELTLVRNPQTVPAGGSRVVQITSCNAAAGDRMGAYLTRSNTCNAATDTKIGTYGDGGSAADGSNFALIAGSVPCAGDHLTITDLATGATQDAPVVVY